jgi:hypothetical protein
MESAEDSAGGAARDPQALSCRHGEPKATSPRRASGALPAAGSAESSQGGAWATTALGWAVAAASLLTGVGRVGLTAAARMLA